MTTAAGGTFSFPNLIDDTYKVRVRCATTGDADTPIARLDVFNYWLSKEGKDGTCAQTPLRAENLVRSGEYADYWLDFEHGDIGKVEYRVWWTGRSPLSLDRVVIFRRP